MEKIMLWLDDKRLMPSDYNYHVKSASDAILILKSGNVSKISMDHDLGPEDLYGNGHMVSDFIEIAAFYNTIPRLEWHIHSSNGPEVTRMRITLERADMFWSTFEIGH